MATIRSGTLLQRMQDFFGLTPGADIIPNQTPNQIVPVVEVGLALTDEAYATTSSSTGTFTLYTTPANKDCYLTFAQLQFQKDATCDTTFVGISVVPKTGATSIRLVGQNFNLTGSWGSTQNITFPKPILLKRGSIVAFEGSFTTGALVRSASVGITLL